MESTRTILIINDQVERVLTNDPVHESEVIKWLYDNFDPDTWIKCYFDGSESEPDAEGRLDTFFNEPATDS